MVEPDHNLGDMAVIPGLSMFTILIAKIAIPNTVWNGYLFPGDAPVSLWEISLVKLRWYETLRSFTVRRKGIVAKLAAWYFDRQAKKWLSITEHFRQNKQLFIFKKEI